MEIKRKITEKPRILYSCYEQNSREGETFISNHVLSYILSGTQEMRMGNKTFNFKEGDIRFFRKNQLASFVKRPVNGAFKSISIYFDEATLRNISMENNLSAGILHKNESVFLLKHNTYLIKYLDSLSPYIEGTGENNDKLSSLKVKEAIMILLETNPLLKNLLFDFNKPGKIDLEAFMNEHYRHNQELGRFAFLTGRSLSTFKRDFEQIFKTTPNRWLLQRRLEDAYYLIKEKGKKPSEIYFDLGFADLSHFSFAFKKAYKIAPSKLLLKIKITNKRLQ